MSATARDGASRVELAVTAARVATPARPRGDSAEYLFADPAESRNLASDKAYAELMRRAHLRLEARVSFQNRYLARFEDSRVRSSQ